MGKEGVEVGFGAEMEDLGIMRMVDMSEDSQKLPVHMLDHGRESLGEIFA